MSCNLDPQAAPRGMCKTADVSLAVYRAGRGPAWSQREAVHGSGPSGELIVGQRAFVLLERGLPWQVFSPTKAL